MRPLVVCCSIALCWFVPALRFRSLAQELPRNCQIVATQSGQMFPYGSPATKLESFGSDSYIRVECRGNISGRLRLSLASGSKLYNGSAGFRLVSTSGIFAPMTTEYADSPVIVPYANASGRASGEVRYQVRVVAPSGYLLPAGSDYALKLQAESLP
jgi:hypothetical protein